MRVPARVAFRVDDVLPHLIQQESSGRVGVSGPQTQYGRAQGLTQVLPSTGQGVARNLGIAWRPDLMSGTSNEAAAYQRRIGAGYLGEAQRNTGTLGEALMYYHGGPDRRKWGPKTRAYATSIMRRMGV